MATVIPQEVPKEVYWRVTAATAFVIAIVFFWPFLGIIVFAAIMAFLFYPLYRWFDKYLSDFFAAGATIIASILVVLIPVTIVFVVAVSQGVTLANNIASGLQVDSPDSMRHDIEAAVNETSQILSSISSDQLHIDVQSVKTFITTTVPALLQSFVAVIVGFASSIPVLITNATIYLFLFAAFIINGKNTLNNIRKLSPFDGFITDLYIVRTGGMIKASMLSQLLISFVLSVLTAFLLILIGGGPYFFLLVIVMTLLNMIPLGSGILVYPLTIVAILLGNVAGGLWVLVIYTLGICNLDSLMRPRLIPKSVQLAPALMTLSVFCGIYYFGVLGVVYGPVIAILLFTTYEINLERRQQPKHGKKAKKGGVI